MSRLIFVFLGFDIFIWQHVENRPVSEGDGLHERGGQCKVVICLSKHLPNIYRCQRYLLGHDITRDLSSGRYFYVMFPTLLLV